ncbi:hypothetical protein Hanom_Chr03g00230771 [Helianthus anomalus]
MVKLVYEVDRRRRRKMELGFRPVTISHSRSCFKTMSPAKCNGRTARIPPQTQPQRQFWLIFCNIGSRSSQTGCLMWCSPATLIGELKMVWQSKCAVIEAVVSLVYFYLF